MTLQPKRQADYSTTFVETCHGTWHTVRIEDLQDRQLAKVAECFTNGIYKPKGQRLDKDFILQVSNGHPINKPCNIDLTPEGEQYVIPGAEHTPFAPTGGQGDLW